MHVVRISRNSFDPDHFEEVRSRLEASGAGLVPAIEGLPGLVAYYAGADQASSTMVNVSVWESVEAAEQMAALPEMLALAAEFIDLGVDFERPIVNYGSLWQI